VTPASTSWSESFYWKTRALLMPQLENSQVEYSHRLRAALSGATRWLDVGCGHAVFPAWLSRRTSPLDLSGRMAVGLDPDRQSLARHEVLKLRVAGDAAKLPFEADSFDLVTANMVLEHVEEPASLFQEIARVLRPGGRFLVHTPNSHGYTTMLTRLVPPVLRSGLAGLLQGRHVADVYPTFYRANESSVLGRLAASAGLEIERFEFVQTSPQLMAIAPLMVGEMLIIRALRADRLSRFRACLLVDFRKPAV